MDIQLNIDAPASQPGLPDRQRGRRPKPNVLQQKQSSRLEEPEQNDGKGKAQIRQKSLHPRGDRAHAESVTRRGASGAQHIQHPIETSASDDEEPQHLDEEDLKALQDAVISSKQQELRIAEAERMDARQSVQSGAHQAGSQATSLAANNSANDPHNKSSKLLQEPKPAHLLARDHVKNAQCSHVPRAAHKQLYGRNAGSFADLGLTEDLCKHLSQLHYTTPTAVQQAVIPELLRGRDLLMRAPTGTGKTLAYLAPLIQTLAHREKRISRSEGCHAIIVTPTRELTAQVHKVAVTLVSRFIWLVPGLLIGGENRHHEKQRLRRGVTLLASTPGRLLDHLSSTESFQVGQLQWLVLDEADRLLDMGFQQTLSKIVELLDQRAAMSDVTRQSVLVSATLHSKLGAIVDELLSDPVAVGLTLQRDAAGNTALLDSGPPSDSFQLPACLQQLYMDVPVKLRLPTLLGTVKLCYTRTPGCKAVIFVATCSSVDFLHDFVAKFGVSVLGDETSMASVWKLHGDMPAAERTRSMEAFHACGAGVLLCTDVAARGLDFPSVTHIVQYDPPGDVPEYVQRVGRTARMGRQGVAILMLAAGELEYTEALKRVGVNIKQQKLYPSLSVLPRPAALSARAAAETCMKRRAFQESLDAANVFMARYMQIVSQDSALHKLACDAFRSYVGAYATHASHLKGIFHVRKLHLGHVAHSFGLKEPPRALGRAGTKRARDKPGKGKSRGAKRTKRE